MDVILVQLSPRELEAHCRDAMKTQLMVMQRALNDAVDAANRAGEVQLASQKLSITLDPTAQKKRKSNAPTAEEASVKKRKSPLSTTIERAPKSSAKAPEVVKKPKSAAALAKALEACTNLTEELAKKKKVSDRVPGLKMLVQHFNIAHKNLDPNIIIDQIEALDTLSVVAGMAISIMQHGTPR
ncbi:hypothetical protein JG688_00018035 [Phytophthora aleatoria]|uniref:Uncharacterized protein n=1 Tax=Phytophthora aleatoria TaxID=2496075 RepID=A0A8J5IBJ9_9STRA|nr:hypothetical protein JG688_00018035 [Phytophthora aleatoria]